MKVLAPRKKIGPPPPVPQPLQNRAVREIVETKTSLSRCRDATGFLGFIVDEERSVVVDPTRTARGRATVTPPWPKGCVTVCVCCRRSRGGGGARRRRERGLSPCCAVQVLC